MRSSDLHERVAQLLCLLAINAKVNIVIDGSLTVQLPSLIAQGTIVLFLVVRYFVMIGWLENTRSWRAMFKVAGDTTFYPSDSI